MNVQSQNDITLEEHGSVVTLDMKGDINSYSEPFLMKAYEDATERGARKILIKVDSEGYVDSGGIAVLIQILALADSAKQTIAFTGLTKQIKKIFKMVGITRYANVYDSVENAVLTLTVESDRKS